MRGRKRSVLLVIVVCKLMLPLVGEPLRNGSPWPEAAKARLQAHPSRNALFQGRKNIEMIA
jgi:hypothetical protein